MEYLEQKFNVSYDLKKGCLIRSVGSGTLQNGISYSANVKITARNIFETFNSKTNFNDTKENVLIVKISCDNDYDAGTLALALKEYFKIHDSLKLTGSLPTLQNNEYNVNCDISYSDLMKIIDPKSKTTKAV